MAIKENRIEELLMNTVFTDNAHKEALRRRLHSDVVELEMDELGMVAGGVDAGEGFHLIDESMDEWKKWG